MTPRSAIQKGKLLEHWIRDRLKDSGLDLRANRTPGSGSGMEKGDVSNGLNLAIEAKNTKSFSSGYWKQAKRQAIGDYQRPVLVWHPPHEAMENSVVMIEWSFFEELMLRSREPIIKTENREVAWKLKKLVLAAKEMLKEFKADID
jgi:hypothetical protein